MLTQEKIKECMEGKAGICTFIVQSHPAIIPTIVLNTYISLGASFLAMEQTVKEPPKIALANAQAQVIQNYFFAMDTAVYETLFGTYHPTKILSFEIPTKGQ